MSIAKKLTAIAENEQKVYDAGFAAGQAAGGGGEVDSGRYAYSITFKDWSLFDKTEIALTVYNSTTLAYTFERGTGANHIVEHMTVTCLVPPAKMVNAFYVQKADDNTLKRLTLNADTSKSTDWNYAFRGNRGLQVIDGTPLDLSASTGNFAYTFYVCNSLVEVRFVKESIHLSITFSTSQKLSAETIQSIIDGLADLTGQTTQTLTLSETSARSLTEAQKATITAKNWTLVG